MPQKSRGTIGAPIRRRIAVAMRIAKSFDAARCLDTLWQWPRFMALKTRKATLPDRVDIASIGGCGGSQHPILATDRKSRSTIGGVEPLPSEGKGHTFESCRVRHKIKGLSQN